MSKANNKSTPKTTPAAPAKMIPAVVVLSETCATLEGLEAVLTSMDGMYAAITEADDQNQWALGMSYIAIGVRDKIREVRERFNKMIIKGGPGGEALGIEKK